jgi:hypothetical protein
MGRGGRRHAAVYVYRPCTPADTVPQICTPMSRLTNREARWCGGLGTVIGDRSRQTSSLTPPAQAARGFGVGVGAFASELQTHDAG